MTLVKPKEFNEEDVRIILGTTMAGAISGMMLGQPTAEGGTLSSLHMKMAAGAAIGIAIGYGIIYFRHQKQPVQQQPVKQQPVIKK